MLVLVNSEAFGWVCRLVGYFEQQDGVNWKIKRRNEEEADVDLFVKEAKTGHANIQAGFGGVGTDFNSPSEGFNVKGTRYILVEVIIRYYLILK